MAFSLAKESAKSLIDLKSKLIEVRDLSEVTLKQEQEKQGDLEKVKILVV